MYTLPSIQENKILPTSGYEMPKNTVVAALEAVKIKYVMNL